MVAVTAGVLLSSASASGQGSGGFDSGHYMEHDRQLLLVQRKAKEGAARVLRSLFDGANPDRYKSWEDVLVFAYLNDFLGQELLDELARWDRERYNAWKNDPPLPKNVKPNPAARKLDLQHWYRAQDWHDFLHALGAMRTGDAAAAEVRLKKVLRLEPGDKRHGFPENIGARARALMGEVKLAQGDLPAAERYLRECLQALPPKVELSDDTLCYDYSPGREQWLMRINAKSLLSLVYGQTGRVNEAHQLAQEAFSSPLFSSFGSREARPLQAYALLRATIDAGRFHEALDALAYDHSGENAFLEENRFRPYAFEADWLRTLVAAHFSRYRNRAIGLAERLTERHPQDPRLRELLALVLARAGDARALGVVQEARKLAPEALNLAVFEAQLLYGLQRETEVAAVLAPLLPTTAGKLREIATGENLTPTIWALVLTSALHRRQIAAPGLPAADMASSVALELAGSADQLDRLRVQQQERMGSEATARGGSVLLHQLHERSALDYDTIAIGVRMMNRLKEGAAAIPILNRAIERETDGHARLSLIALRGEQRRHLEIEPELMRADYAEVISAQPLHFRAWSDLEKFVTTYEGKLELRRKVEAGVDALAFHQPLDRDRVMLAQARWTEKIEAARAKYDAGMRAAATAAYENHAKRVAEHEARTKAYLEELKKRPNTPLPRPAPRSPWAAALNAQVRSYEGTYHQRVDRSIGYYTDTIGSDGVWRRRWVQL